MLSRFRAKNRSTNGEKRWFSRVSRNLLIYCSMKRNLSQAVLSAIFQLFLKFSIFFWFSTFFPFSPFIFKEKSTFTSPAYTHARTFIYYIMSFFRPLFLPRGKYSIFAFLYFSISELRFPGLSIKNRKSCTARARRKSEPTAIIVINIAGCIKPPLKNCRLEIGYRWRGRKTTTPYFLPKRLFKISRPHRQEPQARPVFRALHHRALQRTW